MDSVNTFLILMFAAVILVGIAQKIHLSYPIALVLGGTAIGFIPGLESINFDPNFILLVVLPPILYYAAYGISFREFKHNWRDIFSLALGLVVFTTLVIGILFKWIFPEFPWALAFAFGAIVSPPDAVAATAVLKRFGIGPRLLTILEGESLINDASALVLYRLAVAALLSGVFSLSDGIFSFITISTGGVLVGFVLGIIIQRLSKNFLDPVVGVVLSFTIPYITYILADYLGVSGVLAVVVNGLIGAHTLPSHHSSQRRIIGFATWDIFVILMNCFVFILIGLQLRVVTSTMTNNEIVLYIGYALLISFVMFLVRMLWVYTKSAIFYFRTPNHPNDSSLPRILSDAALIGWSGMRGIVSLAAALALPFTLPNGMPLEGRNEVIFITFVIILISLLIPALTLSALIQWLKIPQHLEVHGAHRIRKQLVRIAEEKIQYLHTENSITDEEYEFLKLYFHVQRRVLDISSSAQKKLQKLETARLKVLQAQRKELVKMWENLEIDDKLLNQLEHELDAEETHLARAELK